APARRRDRPRERRRPRRPGRPRRLHVPRARAPGSAHRRRPGVAHEGTRLVRGERERSTTPSPRAGELSAASRGQELAAFPRRAPLPEPWARRRLRCAGRLHQWVEVLLDRLVAAPLNPLYHTGTIAVFSLAVATVTGIYLFLFYRVGTEAAPRSI